MQKLIAVSALTLGLWACGADEDVVSEKGKTQQSERIDSRNDPSAFRLSLVRRFADLPTEGESLRKPFPSNWWPMRTGGAARSWYSNEAGPTEKYDQLVHSSQIRDVQMTLAKRNWKGEPVNTDAQPENFRIGPATEWEHKNHGRYGNTDPDSWWGHCNGWASYVLNEDEPIREVWVRLNGSTVSECAPNTAGCVLFRLGDINALGAELYWNDAARLLGRRCEQEKSKFEFDASGRINAIECRDGNAGSWHIVAANMLGAMQRPFILDLNADFEVWNYPVYRYQILEDYPLTVQEALAEIGAPSGTTTWIYNTSAVELRRIQMRAWIVEDAVPPMNVPTGDQLARYTTLETYDYILELDAAGDIIGGEWIGNSKTNHADFIWYSFSPDSTNSDDRYDGDNPHLRFGIFKQILTLAQRPATPPPTGNTLRISRTPRISIPDNMPSGISDTISVSESFNATSVAVSVEITHTYSGDLVLVLEHAGRQFSLRANEGGSTHNIRARFNVSDAAGLAAAGDWRLLIVDNAAADVGTLDSWTLELGRSGGGGGGGTPVSRSYDVTASLSIPDNNTTGISSTLTISDDIRINDLKVTIDLTHTWVGDLTVTLSNGTATQTLHDRAGGSQRNIHTTFPTRAFQNANARGTWTLTVKDTASRDVGTLDAWSVVVDGVQ
jgi:subtilisin-like proprotein convertase family protein